MAENDEIRHKKWSWESIGWKTSFASTAFGSCVPGLLILLITNTADLFKKKDNLSDESPLPRLNLLINRLFLAFLIIVFISGLVSTKPGISVPLSLAFGLMVWIFVFKSQSLGGKQILFDDNHLLVLTISSVLAWLISLIRLYFFEHNPPFHAQNIFGGINGFGTTLILVGGLVVGYLMWLGGNWRYLTIPYTGLTIWAFMANQSRGAWFGLAAMLAAFTFVNRKALIVAIIIVVIIGLVFSFIPAIGNRFLSSFSFAASTNAERIFMWGITLKMIRDHAIFGIGAGVYPYVYETYLGPGIAKKFHNMQFSHNLFLEAAVEFGLIGLAVFLVIIGIVVIMAFSLARTGNIVYQAMFAVLIGVLVNQMVDIPIWGIDIGGFFWMLVGIIIGSYQHIKTKELTADRN